MSKTGILAALVAALGTAAPAAYDVTIPPLDDGEVWWGARGESGPGQPWRNTGRQRIGCAGAQEMPLLLSNRGRYVWSDRPFDFSLTNGFLNVVSETEEIRPVQAGATLREAYLAACRKHFPFTDAIPARELFTHPQWNNWIEIAIQGMNQKSVDAYTAALAASGFPCGVYIMDGGWFSHQGSYQFHAPDFPDPQGMFARIREHGWKTMIWTANFVSPDSREYKILRRGRGYMINGRDYLAYDRDARARGRWDAGIVRWWSGCSCVWDLTYEPAWEDYAETLARFAQAYGIDGYKYDAGDVGPLSAALAYHDPAATHQDYVRAYVRVGATRFPFNEYRVGWRTGGWPVMQRLSDVPHRWKDVANVSAKMQVLGLIGSPYCVADMIGGGEACTFRPGGYFSEKLFVRSCALAALHPMMQFSAAPWRYLSPDGVKACRAFADLHVKFGPYILNLARHASYTGEPILRAMAYEFPNQGFDKPMTQFMLGSEWLVAPVVSEDDSVTVELPPGEWHDDLGLTHIGPQVLHLIHVPLTRLPRYSTCKIKSDVVPPDPFR